MTEIEKAAVVGAGVMGSAIAAHFANAGVPALLLDVVPEGAKNRNIVAEAAIERLLRGEPPAFMHSRAAGLVKPANVSDHLDLLASVDWIVEAVFEDLAAKKDLYRKIEAVRREGSIVTSNTSTLSLARLTEGMPGRFCRDFLITHFFNPPRYIRLLEVVAGPKTRPEAVAAVRDFADRRLGKAVVRCRDTPGFIANRIGAFWLKRAVAQALEQGLAVEEADSVMSRALGVPKTGVFGLLDLVGLDLMLQVDRNLLSALSEDDPYRKIGEIPLVRALVGRGYTGRKGEGGFYRGEEAIDLKSGDYRPLMKPELESLEASEAAGLRGLLEFPDKGGRYAREVLYPTLAYASRVAPEIADNVHLIDRAMKLGYGWKRGPFELIDELGPALFAERLKSQGSEVPDLLIQGARAGSFYRATSGRLQYLDLSGSYVDLTRDEGVLLLSDIKLKTKPLAQNASSSLWDIGDGVACLEIHTKMNAMDPDVLSMVGKAVEIVRRSFKALVIYNEGDHFSAGANLGLLLFAANVAAWSAIEELLAQGQKAFAALKYAPFPVVGAPSGLALGGGCEILLHCDAVQAHAESYIGLVETAVGLVPAWGGTKELLRRLASDPRRPRGPMPPVIRAFETIGLAKVTKSAFEAKELGFLRSEDGITFNRDRLLADAKRKALELLDGYRSPEPARLALPGPSGRAALVLFLSGLRAQGKVTSHDETVAEALAEVLTGGSEADLTVALGEEKILELERGAFVRLLKTEATLQRIEHMLSTGKPLRN